MRKLLNRYIHLLLVLAAIGCKQEPVAFSYLSPQETGITFTNTVTNTAQLNILNYLYFYNGGGVATADFNSDGLADLYFTANQAADELYLNEGNFKFRNITREAGIDNEDGWTTGVTVCDIDGNGYPDLYICKVAPISPKNTHNLLFLNQGPDENGIPVFTEAAAAYGLDFSGYSTQAAFFDQDRDGDLDMYLMNHSVHPNANYGRGSLRDRPDSLSGDRFYRNDGGKYVDDTPASGIHNGKTGYGLGLALGDLNHDGYPDVYIGNDFFENDYLYLNRGDGSFEDINENGDQLGHTSHFSMGNAISDMNNDLWPDIISVDMLPEDLQTYKTSGLEFPNQIYRQYLRNGYQPQYMQNTLHWNQGNTLFSETAYQSGVAASEWSWCPLTPDLDNDGYRDLFITNGIAGATNDMDFVSFIANEEIQKQLGDNMSDQELGFIEKLPVKRTANVIFRNDGQKGFKKPATWNDHPLSFSNGAVAVDLDNDNDLDLVVNNLNEPALVIRNELPAGNAIKIKPSGTLANTMAAGARFLLYAETPQIAEYHPTQGYLSANASGIHFGLGNAKKADSLRVIWPDGSTELFTELKADTTLHISYPGNTQEKKTIQLTPPCTPLLRPGTSSIDFKHKDQPSIEFNRNPLTPYASTNLAPRAAVGDLNGDQLQDICFGGGKTQPASIFLQTPEGVFRELPVPALEEDAIAEGTDQLILDVNGDGHNDLIMVYGGNEFKTGRPLQPKLFLQTANGLQEDKQAFGSVFLNASRIASADIDGDGDPDLCLASNLEPHEFGKVSRQYIFLNDGKGNFTDHTQTIAPDLQWLGNIQDITWTDLNKDGLPDLVAVGHWLSPAIFINTGKKLELQETSGLERSQGWWNTVKAADIDRDGDIDLIAGNWGLNSRLKADEKHPVTLYRQDMDNNGTIETIISYHHNGVETPFSSKEELSKQLPFLNKAFLSYDDFAKASMEDLFGSRNLRAAEKHVAYELRSCYFINNGDGSFTKKTLPFESQSAPLKDLAIEDLNNDGYPDIIAVGNHYEISTQLGRLDANRGLVVLNDQHGRFLPGRPIGITGPMNSITPIKVNGEQQWIVTRNNDTPIFLQPTN